MRCFCTDVGAVVNVCKMDNIETGWSFVFFKKTKKNLSTTVRIISVKLKWNASQNNKHYQTQNICHALIPYIGCNLWYAVWSLLTSICSWQELPTSETNGETGSVNPKRSQKAVLQHENKRISILALLSGIVWVDRPSLPREFQEWAIQPYWWHHCVSIYEDDVIVFSILSHNHMWNCTHFRHPLMIN